MYMLEVYGSKDSESQICFNDPQSNEVRLAALEAMISAQAEMISSLKRENTEIKAAVGWDDDPDVRRAKRTLTAATLSSAGWWIGAIALSEGLRAISGATLHEVMADIPFIAYAQSNTTWIAGVLFGAEPGQKFFGSIGIKLAMRMQGKGVV